VNVSVKQPQRLKKKSSQSHLLLKQPSSRTTGILGEERAAQFLVAHGYQVIGRNVRFGHDEIDIICWDVQQREVVFVEVKTRTSSYSGSPTSAIDRRKLIALRRAAVSYLKQVWKRAVTFRIDVVGVELGKITHYPNVSWEMVK
jgi:putative endonuclease